MNNIKDELLSDAIKTSLDYSCTILKLKRVIIAETIIIIGLLIYFI